jgi:hypothetical protein
MSLVKFLAMGSSSGGSYLQPTAVAGPKKIKKKIVPSWGRSPTTFPKAQSSVNQINWFD